MSESEHRVAFHVQDRAVICTCGEYFRAQHIGMGMLSDPLGAWAHHLRESNGINLADAYEAGWHDHFIENQRQEKDPAYPIGRGKRTNYPSPETIASREGEGD